MTIGHIFTRLALRRWCELRAVSDDRRPTTESCDVELRGRRSTPHVDLASQYQQDLLCLVGSRERNSNCYLDASSVDIFPPKITFLSFFFFQRHQLIFRTAVADKPLCLTLANAERLLSVLRATDTGAKRASGSITLELTTTAKRATFYRLSCFPRQEEIIRVRAYVRACVHSSIVFPRAAGSLSGLGE